MPGPYQQLADPQALAAAGELANSPQMWSELMQNQAPQQAQYAERPSYPDRKMMTADEHLQAWPNVAGFFEPQKYASPTMRPLLESGRGMARQVLDLYSAGDPRAVDEVTKLAQRNDMIDGGKIDRRRLEHELMYQAVNDRVGHRMFDDPSSLSAEQLQELKRLFNFDTAGRPKFPFEVLDRSSPTGKQPVFVPGDS